LDGSKERKPNLLKPIDKVRIRRVSKYPGCNESERRSSLDKVKSHWPSLFNIGEGSISSPGKRPAVVERWRGSSGDTDRKKWYQLGKPSSSLKETTGARVDSISRRTK
jgi:hypothetical protein